MTETRIVKSEGDVINLWFTRRLTVWWRQWRWGIIALLVILVLHTVRFSLGSNLGFLWLEALPPELMIQPQFVYPADAALWLFWERFSFHFHDALVIPAMVIPLTLAASLTWPEELAAVAGEEALVNRKRQWVRVAAWLCFAVMFLVPLGISWLFISGLSLPPLTSELIPVTGIYLCWIVIFLAISEWVSRAAVRGFTGAGITAQVLLVSAMFIVFRLALWLRMRHHWESWLHGQGIGDVPIDWIAFNPIWMVTTLVLLYLVSAGCFKAKKPRELSDEDREILRRFYVRRKLFDDYLKEHGIDRFTCPACGYPTVTEPACFNICDYCDWEDDGQDDPHADEAWGGPNGRISLSEWRLHFGREGEDRPIDDTPEGRALVEEIVRKILADD